MRTGGRGYLRMPRIPFALFLSAIMLLALTACAVRTAIEPVSPSAAAANRKYENIIFRTATADNELPNQAEAMLYCLRSAMDHLQATNVYKRVEKQGAVTYPEPTLFVDLRLVDLRIVSSTARMWGGALSGRSHMKVNVKLTDPQGAVVAEQELFGAPNAYGSLYSGGRSDVDLPKNMGILVGDYVLANTGRK